MFKNIKDEQERADARLEFGLKHNLDVAKHRRNLENDKLDQEERNIKQEPDSKVPLVAEFRKQISDENPGLRDKDPEEYNDLVMERYNKQLSVESNRKVAERKAGRAAISPTNTAPADVRRMIENVVRGELSLSAARSVLVGQNKDPSAFFKMMEMGEGRVIRGTKTKEALQTAQKGFGVASQLKNLALEARKVSQEQTTLGFVDPDPQSESFQGLKADIEGAIARLSGVIGSNAAATVFERLIPGIATTLARAGGETGRISDADVQRFIKQAPKLSDTLEELDVLEREINKLTGLNLMSHIANGASTMGERKRDPDAKVWDFTDFVHKFRNNTLSADGIGFRDKLGTNDIVEALVKIWEQGTDITF